ncbi:MAG: MBL fold metallo-hydrolase [Hahellaceae bacterium]|nr:MBL fold metallo-hydrolase [Hahellaceae bacterium]
MRPRKILTAGLILALMVTGGAYWLLQRPLPERYQSWLKERVVLPSQTPGKQLTVTFLGTTTLLFSDGRNALMTDGFFSRPGLLSLLLGRFAPDTALIARQLTALGVTQLDAVMPVHSHHDHAMDAPEVARQTGAVLLGSDSTRQIGLGAGLPEQQIGVVTPGTTRAFGDFSVTWLDSPHSPVPPLIARLTGNGEVITAPVMQPATLRDYKEGQTFALLVEHPAATILVLGSAAANPEALKGTQVDGVFLGVATLSKQPSADQQALVKTTIVQTGAKWVIPIHWDDFTQPAEPALVPMPTRIDDLLGTLEALQEQLEVSRSEDSSSPHLALLPMRGQVQIE